MIKEKRENINTLISALSLLVALIAIVISIYSNSISKKSLLIAKEPLIRAIIEWPLDENNMEKMIINIHNDGPVLTDFNVTPIEFIFINNTVPIPADLNDTIKVWSSTFESKGLIISLAGLGVFNFIDRYNLALEDYSDRYNMFGFSEEEYHNRGNIWDFTEFFTLLKISYSDKFHESSIVYLLLSNDQQRGKYINTREAEALLKLLQKNANILITQTEDYYSSNLKQLILEIRENKGNLKRLKRRLIKKCHLVN